MTVQLRIDRLAQAAPRRPTVPRRRRIGPAALVSLGLHVALIGLLVFWMRRSVPIALEPADNPATVQLVMSPPGGETPPAAAPQPETQPAPDAPQEAAATPKTPPGPDAPQEAAAMPKTPPAPDAQQEAAATPKTPPAAPTTADAAPPPTTAPPPPTAPAESDDKLTFDFAQVESDTNAWVTGDSVVPASPDIKFHNRKPSYPNEAAYRGEQGAVVVLIHVSAEGLVSGADVVESSGYATLDRAARDAVLTWHFLPSVRAGQPVPAEVPVRFVFALD
jgi:periplasmic protein TonB